MKNFKLALFIKCSFAITALFLVFIFSGCDEEQEHCKNLVSKNYTWLHSTQEQFGYRYYDEKQISKFTFFYAHGPNSASQNDICPYDAVLAYAKVTGVDGHFSPEPHYCRLVWKGYIGKFYIEDYITLVKSSDNTWEGEIALAHLFLNYGEETPGKLDLEVEIFFNNGGNFEGGVAWLKQEFSKVYLSVDYTQF